MEKPLTPKPALGAPIAPPAQPNPGTGLDPRVAPYLQPQLDLIASQEKAKREALQQFTANVLAQLAQFGPAVANEYDQAIGQSQALAQAGADSLARANGNADLQATLAAINAPSSQRDQIASKLNNAYNGGSAALFGINGVFPGQALIAQKAANVAFTDQLPGINAQAGIAALRNLLAQGDTQRAQVLAQAPSILNQIASNDLAQKKFNADQAYRNSTLGLQQTKAQQAAANDAFSRWYREQTLKQGNRRLSNQEAQQSFNQWATQQGLDVRWANVGLANQRLAASKSKPRYTALQISKFKATAADTAMDGFFGVKLNPDDVKLYEDGKIKESQIRHVTGPEVAQVPGDYVVAPKHYQDVLADLTSHGVPLGVAQQALNRYWRKPGFESDVASRAAGVYDNWVRATKGRGRPITPYQQRNGRGKGGAAAETAASTRALAAASLVREYLGTPYSWGGGGSSGPSYGIGRGAMTKGFDCSGLIQYVWAKQGVAVPRTTYEQWKTGTAVAKSRLQPGDAVFFEPTKSGPGHVGLYIGGGQFIEAPHTGASVRISSLAGRTDYVGARRFG